MQNGTIYTRVGDLLQTAIASGDFEQLENGERTSYYNAVCESLGLNPLTRPFEFMTLNGKLILYAKRDATDQLRQKHHVSIEIVDRTTQENVHLVRARATLPDGRTDESMGAVSLAGLEGEALANALMKAETKAKRRVALSICGLGMLDETEVDTIPGAAMPEDRAETNLPTASMVFHAWDAAGHRSRRALYDHVKVTFGKRVTALGPDELNQVLTWIAAGSPSTPVEERSDAA
jgi:hypothetical protein